MTRDMYLPTDTPPVKVISSTLGLVSISSAISFGSPVTTENIEGAAHFVKRVLQTEARFQGDHPGDLLAAGIENLRGLAQDARAVMAAEGRLISGNFVIGGTQLLQARLGNGADDLSVIGIAHLDDALAPDQLASNPHLFLTQDRGGEIHGLGLRHRWVQTARRWGAGEATAWA